MLPILLAPLLAALPLGPSPAALALTHGDLEGALSLPSNGPQEEIYLRARVALAHWDLALARTLATKLDAEDRPAAELAWMIAHAERNPAGLSRAAVRLCALGDPTGRACADAKLYRKRIAVPSVDLAASTTLPTSAKAPFPLTLANAGTGPTGFVIDSGASDTVISSRLANKLHLRLTKAGFPVRVAGAGGRASAHLAILPVLTLGAATLRNTPVLVMDLDDLDRAGIEGILAPQQALAGLTVAIDLGAHQLRIERGSPKPSHARSATVPYRMAGLDLAVEARVEGGRAALFGLDTGMAGAYAIAADYLPSEPTGATLALHGAGANSLASTLAPRTVQLGSLTLTPTGTCVRSSLSQGGMPLAGLLGNGLWANGVITFDTVAHNVTVELDN